MKLLFLILAFLISAGCVSQASSVNEVSKFTQPTPTIGNLNANTKGQYSYSDYKYDQSLLGKLSAENEKFRQVPDEFKSVYFENFKYDFGRLKNGELEKSQSNNPLDGSENFRLTDYFYVDLIGDSKKEAVVFTYRVTCGASCDGGADYVYFYSSRKGKPQLIDTLKTGSNSGGCSLKTFAIKNKKIIIEQFGRCVKDAAIDENKDYFCKFCVKDETHTIYSISKKGLKRESADIFETETINVMNSPAFISINE